MSKLLARRNVGLAAALVAAASLSAVAFWAFNPFLSALPTDSSNTTEHAEEAPDITSRVGSTPDYSADISGRDEGSEDASELSKSRLSIADELPSVIQKASEDELPFLTASTVAGNLMDLAQAFADESTDLLRELGGTAISICGWSEADFLEMMEAGYFPDVDRALRSRNYLIHRLDSFCHGYSISVAADIHDVISLAVIDDTVWLDDWFLIRETGTRDDALRFIESRLSEASYAARFISHLANLNILAAMVDWPLGQEQLGLTFMRDGSLLRVRRLAADMLWCDIYGGCGPGGAITLRECMIHMVCDAGVTLADVWDMRYSLAEIEGARRLADELREVMPSRRAP